MVAWVALIMFLPRLVRLGLSRLGWFFSWFFDLFKTPFFHRFCRLLGPLRAPFSTLFPTFSHHLLLFLAFRFYIVFSMPFEWILASFLMTFSMLFKEITVSVKLVKSIDFPSKTNDFQGSAASFFHVFSTHVRSFFGIEIYIDFIVILGAILAPFSTLYDPLAIILGYLFGVVFFMFFCCRFRPLLAQNL